VPKELDPAARKYYHALERRDSNNGKIDARTSRASRESSKRFSDLEATETDQHNVTHSKADLPPHFATNVAHTLYTIETVRLQPRATVHLEHLRVLLALIYVLEMQLALAVAIALGA
jgi:hypothetical protein